MSKAAVVLLALGIVLCNGVTHWRVQEEVIRAIDHTVIIGRETCTDCPSIHDDVSTNNKVTVYDKEFAIIIKSHHVNQKRESLLVCM